MSLSVLGLAILLFLMGANWLQWFQVPAGILGVFAVITAALLVVEGAPIVYRKYFVR